MAVDNLNVIDSISIRGDQVFLTISDHLLWDERNKHLSILQDKINSYLDVIQNGQIYKLYPDTIDKVFSILVHLKYEPNKDAILFLNKTKLFLDANGYEFNYKHLI